MERLSGLDASFLYLETPSLHMHVSMAAVFDPSTVPGGYSFERTRRLIASRLVQAPIFRRRLVEVPFRLGHPYWVEDATFDIDYHLRRAALPAPGGLDELATFVGDVCSRQLDRSKPLWEMYVVEGLQNGAIAVVTKIHHCTIDGVSGAELLARLFDLSADTPPADGAEVGAGPAAHRGQLRFPGGLPSDWRLVGEALVSRFTQPFGMARLAYRTGRAVLDVRRVRSSTANPSAALPLTTPRTSLNSAITPHRKVAFASISLEDVKAVKRALDCTVNDVVLAVCTGALRRYLEQNDELPETPLVATVPVSVQPAHDAPARGSNKVSAMFVGLPVHLDDPLERVEAIRGGTRGAKEEHKALGADVLMNWTEHASPNLFATAARAYSHFRLADRHRPIHSLVVSNVPGPDFPLYLSGAELQAGFPLGPVMDGAGLNVTVMSYRGVLNWGLMACAETVAGVDRIATAIPEALAELLDAAHLGRPHPAGIADGRPAPRRAATRRARNAGNARTTGNGNGNGRSTGNGSGRSTGNGSKAARSGAKAGGAGGTGGTGGAGTAEKAAAGSRPAT